jgi:hypothetical protein
MSNEYATTNVLPYADVSPVDLPHAPELMSLLPLDVQERFQVIPLAQRDGKLIVGVQNKLNHLQLTELRAITGCQITCLRLSSSGRQMGNFDSLKGESIGPARPVNPRPMFRPRSSPLPVKPSLFPCRKSS